MEAQTPASVGRLVRAMRVLTALSLGPGQNAKDLAKRFNVSRRTIYRDIELLRESGVDVYFDEQHDVYRLADGGHAVEPPHVEDDELTMLVLTAQLSLLHSFPGFAASVRETLFKLLARHPAGVRESLARLLNSCVVRVPDTKYTTDSLEKLGSIFKAIREQRQVRIAIQLNHEPPRRTKFAPYRVEVWSDRCAIVGRSSLHRCKKTFDIANIIHAEITDDRYQIPRGYRYWD